MDELRDQDPLRDLMKKSKLEMPFSDFEASVMQRIDVKVIEKSKLSKELKLSKFFFILGTLFGILISIVLANIKLPVFGLDQNVVAIVFQIIFATLFFTQFEKFIKLKSKT